MQEFCTLVPVAVVSRLVLAYVQSCLDFNAGFPESRWMDGWIDDDERRMIVWGNDKGNPCPNQRRRRLVLLHLRYFHKSFGCSCYCSVIYFPLSLLPVMNMRKYTRRAYVSQVCSLVAVSRENFVLGSPMKVKDIEVSHSHQKIKPTLDKLGRTKNWVRVRRTEWYDPRNFQRIHLLQLARSYDWSHPVYLYLRIRPWVSPSYMVSLCCLRRNSPQEQNSEMLLSPAWFYWENNVCNKEEREGNVSKRFWVPAKEGRKEEGEQSMHLAVWDESIGARKSLHQSLHHVISTEYLLSSCK